jgi:hypothetical protein
LEGGIKADHAGRIRAEADEVPIGADRLVTTAGLMCRHAEVQPCRGEARGVAEGLIEAAPCLASFAQLMRGDAKAVQGDGVIRVEAEHGVEALLGATPVAGTQLGLTEGAPAIEGTGLKSHVVNQGLGGPGSVALFEPEVTEVEPCDREVGV